MVARIEKILRGLEKLYPDVNPSLNFSSSFELLVATILSAQCTDKRVNMVTPALFKHARTPRQLARLPLGHLKRHIRSTGFFNSKARNLHACAKALLEKFDGEVPATLAELQTLPGVGRKTASVVLAQAFGIPAFPVDRHVLRVSNRLGLAHAPASPDKTDVQVRKKIPPKYWIKLHLQLIYHGRRVCRPKPKCNECLLVRMCPYGKRRLFR